MKNNLKNAAIGLLATVLSVGLLPSATYAGAAPGKKVVTEAEAAEAQCLIDRLGEIKSMDLSSLTPAERHALKKEVRTIDKRLHDIGGGVYISAGALLVVIILLIIFL